jgi:hypothetical protein
MLKKLEPMLLDNSNNHTTLAKDYFRSCVTFEELKILKLYLLVFLVCNLNIHSV